MSTVSKASITSAPRDKDQLVRLGRFQLRALAGDLGLLGTEESKSAFMALPVDDQASAVADALKEADKSGGGKTEAPAAAAEKPKRSPVPQSSMKSESSSEGNGGGDNKAVLDGLGKILEDIGNVHEKLNVLNDRAIKAEKMAAAGMTLSLMLAEEVMQGAARPDVLKAALDDYAEVLKSFEPEGKGKKGK